MGFRKFLCSIILPFIIAYAHGQINVKKPHICHDSKQRLVCYDDSTYTFQFSKNKIVGFSTNDGLLKYYETSKLFEIINTSNPLDPDSIITIQLIKKSVIIKTGTKQVNLDSIYSSSLNISGFTLELTYENFSTSIKFNSGNKRFSLKIDKWPLDKNWAWDIIETHDAYKFLFTYNIYKYNNRPEFIDIRDDSLKYGMTIFLSFRSHKYLRSLESFYTERSQEGDLPIVSIVKLIPSYRYEYNLFGRLKRKSCVGEVNLCQCK